VTNFDPTTVTAVATAVIALFTIVLAWVGGVQAYRLGQTINLARHEFLSTHRPRIILREVYLNDGNIWFRLVNIGDTPATIIESYRMAEIVQPELMRPLLSTGHNDLGQIRLAAGEMKELSYKPDDSLGFFGQGHQSFAGHRYFTGTIIYTDDLGVRRRSVFRRLFHEGGRQFRRLSADQERDNEYAD
jgi:hypothetical protein